MAFATELIVAELLIIFVFIFLLRRISGGLLTGDDGSMKKRITFHNTTSLPYPKEYKHFDYGLQHKFAIKRIFTLFGQLYGFVSFRL